MISFLENVKNFLESLQYFCFISLVCVLVNEKLSFDAMRCDDVIPFNSGVGFDSLRNGRCGPYDIFTWAD